MPIWVSGGGCGVVRLIDLHVYVYCGGVLFLYTVGVERACGK